MRLFMTQSFRKIGIKGYLLNKINGISKKPTANNILNDDRLKVFLLRKKARQRYPLFFHSCLIYWRTYPGILHSALLHKHFAPPNTLYNLIIYYTHDCVLLLQ